MNQRTFPYGEGGSPQARRMRSPSGNFFPGQCFFMVSVLTQNNPVHTIKTNCKNIFMVCFYKEEPLCGLFPE